MCIHIRTIIAIVSCHSMNNKLMTYQSGKPVLSVQTIVRLLTPSKFLLKRDWKLINKIFQRLHKTIMLLGEMD